jgi:hypothetical protein
MSQISLYFIFSWTFCFHFKKISHYLRTWNFVSLLVHFPQRRANTELINYGMSGVCVLVINSLPFCAPIWGRGVHTNPSPPSHAPQFHAGCVKWRSGGERRGLLARLCGLPPNKEPVTRLVKTHHTRHVAPHKHTHTHHHLGSGANLSTTKRADDLVSHTHCLCVLATGHYEVAKLFMFECCSDTPKAICKCIMYKWCEILSWGWYLLGVRKWSNGIGESRIMKTFIIRNVRLILFKCIKNM